MYFRAAFWRARYWAAQFFGAGSGTPDVFTYSPSGGIGLTGHANAHTARRIDRRALGMEESSGSSGGVLTAEQYQRQLEAHPTQVYRYSPSGGIALGGSAPCSMVVAATASGGVRGITGSASATCVYRASASGGVRKPTGQGRARPIFRATPDRRHGVVWGWQHGAAPAVFLPDETEELMLLFGPLADVLADDLDRTLRALAAPTTPGVLLEEGCCSVCGRRLGSNINAGAVVSCKSCGKPQPVGVRTRVMHRH